MRSTIRIAALAIVLAALAVVPAGTELRAQSMGSATLLDLTVTVGGTAQTLVPAFHSDDDFYTVWVANSVSQVTVAGTPDGDATATADQVVTLPAVGATRVNVVVSHTVSGTTTTRTYTVLVIREGTVETDRAALMALYNSAGGANWDNNTHWGSAEPIGTWFGVNTNTDDRVITLNLGSNNNLNGTMPASLGNLTRLRHLSLNQNQLSGTIPDLGSLTSLRHLYLYDNQLSGTIPNLDSLTSLRQLYLNQNQLSGTIPDLGSLTRLTHLSLYNNQLSGTIPNLDSLTSLTQLYLNRNQLSGTIPNLGSLTSLTHLYLYDNQLSGTIPDLGSLTSLTRLYLYDNQLSGTIPNLDSLTSLRHLYLGANQLSGTIPDLGSLTSLRHLYLYDNQLSGTIPSLSSLTSLTHLYLYNNQLSGTIPNLDSLTSLTQLYLGANQLSGTIPDLGSLTSLTRLSLYDNQLSGTIPDLGSLTSLTRLYLYDNQLSGTIPDLGSLTSLTHLFLNQNQLSGTIPDLGSLTSLEELSLRSNQLTGEIRAALGSLTMLNYARFAENELTGCVPHGLRYLLAADEFAPHVPVHDFIAVDANRDGDTDDAGDTPGLNLPFCMLSALALSDGTLVPAFAAGTADYTADMANTVESTTVTATLHDAGDRVSITKGTRAYTSGEDAVPLDVGSNMITIEVTPADARLLKRTYTVQVFREGSVGSDQAALVALYNSAGGASWTTSTNWDTAEPLNMWFGVGTDADGRVTGVELPSNNLRGSLPAELDDLTKLTSLNLSENRLSGTIPDVRDLTELTSLNLGDNQLSGTIPDVRDLTELTSLNLGDNQLSGTIPGWLGSLTSLTTLNLRDNRLTGTIPEELGNLTQLDILYLDDNQLSGPIPEELGNLSGLDVARFAGNTLTGCVPNGLRRLVGALDVDSLPAHDFIAVGGTPGLGLPFCTLETLSLSGVTLEPVFASDAVTYTAAADHAVTSTTVMATLYNSEDDVSITKGADTYTTSVPLDVGPNEITIAVTPADATLLHTYTVTVTRAPNAPPAFGEGPTTTRGVVENTAAGENIGVPIAATDADNDPLQYSLDAAGAESFDIDASSGQLQTKADLDYETKNSYRVTVSVSDGKDADGNDAEMTDDTITVTILVSNVNEAPDFPISETGTRSVDENTIAGENIGAPVAAADDDDDTLTYSLDVSSRATFDIVATTGQLQTKAALDYETGSNSYTVTVTAVDPSAADDTITVTITVNNVDEAGTVTLSSVQPIVGQDLTATLTDPDIVGASPAWSWESSSNRSSWTPIDGADADTYSPVAGDVGRYLRATASYTDAFGSGKSARAVSVNPVRTPVPDNLPPVFPSTETGARNVDENTALRVNIGEPVTATDADNDPLTYSLDADSRATFDIVATTGQLQTKAALDYETGSNRYTGTLTATDTGGDTATIRITITVNNVDEAGTVTLSSPQPLVAIPLTATLDDPDNVSGSATWSWAWSPNGTSDWTPISGAASDTYTPAASDAGDYLRATASYTDGEGPAKGAQAISASTVAVAPGRNKPVLKEYPTATRSVTRNTPAGRNIGAPLTATDADNDALIYSLGGRDRARFDIDTSSGQLLTKAVLTGINRTSYKVFVSVSDGKDDLGNTEANPQTDATTEVTISVTSGGGGGSSGGGFSAGPGEIQLVVRAAVAGEDVPAGQRFGLAFHCTPPDGQPPDAWTFSLGAGQASGRFVPGEIPCSLTVTDDGGADAVDGLFTDMVLGEENLRLVVTFTYGIVTTTVDPTTETVVEEGGVSLTIPEGSRDAPYAVLLETDGENCDGALDTEGEVITCFTVTVFDADGAEETDVTLLVPATVTIALDAARVAELGGIDGVRAARERGELRLLQRDDAESPWEELPFTVEETDDGGVEIVVSVQAFSDFALVTATPRLQTVALYAEWTVVVWDGADGASIPDALGDIAGQVGVIYQWVAETQTWRSHRPGAPPIVIAFDTFTRGASYWIRSSEAVEWTVVGGPVEPPTTEPVRLHDRWTQVVWRGADGADITEALGADVLPQVEVIYRWLAETQTWGSFRPGAPAFLNVFDTFASGGSYWIAVAEAVEWVVAGDGG